MIELAAPLTLLLCSIILEASILQFIKKIDVNWREIIFNLNSGHIILWLFHGLEVLCFNYFYTHFSLNLFEHLPVVFMWLFAIFSWDLGFYWLHRLHHKVPFLWAIHVVHHQGESFNLSLAMRNSWYSSLTAIPFFIFLAILGIPTSVFVIISVIHYSLQFFNHNSLTPKLGFLEKILVTPSHHRIHHIKDKFYSSHNFGGSFIFWDKLFGTFQKSLPKTEFSYGAYIKSSQNPFFASNIPLLRFLNIQYQPKQNVAQYHFSNYLFACYRRFFIIYTHTLLYF